MHHCLLGCLRTRQLTADPAFVEHDDAIAHAQELGQLGRDHDDSRPLPGELAHADVNLGFGAHVDTARRFVQDDQPRLGRQPLGQHDLLLVATAQVLHQQLAAWRPDLESLRPVLHQWSLRPPQQDQSGRAPGATGSAG